jgi:hypothetical protein
MTKINPIFDCTHTTEKRRGLEIKILFVKKKNSMHIDE